MPNDNWKHRSKEMRCRTCMYYVEKITECPITEDDDYPTGRCRRHSPTMSGWPVMRPTDWCGDHKLDENKI